MVHWIDLCLKFLTVLNLAHSGLLGALNLKKTGNHQLFHYWVFTTQDGVPSVQCAAVHTAWRPILQHVLRYLNSARRKVAGDYTIHVRFFFPSRSPTSLLSTGKCLTHLLGCCFSVSLSIFLRVFCFMEVKGLRSEEKWWHQRGRTNLDYGYANFVTTSIFGEDKSSLEGGHVGLGNALTGFCGGWVWRHAVCV